MTRKKTNVECAIDALIAVGDTLDKELNACPDYCRHKKRLHTAVLKTQKKYAKTQRVYIIEEDTEQGETESHKADPVYYLNQPTIQRINSTLETHPFSQSEKASYCQRCYYHVGGACMRKIPACSTSIDCYVTRDPVQKKGGCPQFHYTAQTPVSLIGKCHYDMSICSDETNRCYTQCTKYVANKVITDE
jgi:hypothetical protein